MKDEFLDPTIPNADARPAIDNGIVGPGSGKDSGSGVGPDSGAGPESAAGPGNVRLLDDEGMFELLRSARRIAVVGASSNPARPSYGVFRTLLAAGYQCVPVNPNESSVLGIPAVATLAEAAAGGPIDIVDVFRRAESTEEIARDAVSVRAGALWLQLGVVNWESARIAAAGGLTVVMDRCTAIEIRRSPSR
jgi:predicted CoA-binding protein